MGTNEPLEPTPGAAGPTEETPVPGMQIVRTSIALPALEAMAESMFGNLVKAVVDVKVGTMTIGGEMHADEEALLLDEGSSQSSLWGINLHPEEFGTRGAARKCRSRRRPRHPGPAGRRPRALRRGSGSRVGTARPHPCGPLVEGSSPA